MALKAKLSKYKTKTGKNIKQFELSRKPVANYTTANRYKTLNPMSAKEYQQLKFRGRKYQRQINKQAFKNYNQEMLAQREATRTKYGMATTLGSQAIGSSGYNNLTNTGDGDKITKQSNNNNYNGSLNNPTNNDVSGSNDSKRKDNNDSLAAATGWLAN